MSAPSAFVHRPVVQMCWLVDDVDAAVERWVRTVGAGPWYVGRHFPLENVTYRGGPTTYDHSAALGQFGPLQIELHQKHCSVPSITEELFGPGEYGLHHICWLVEDVDEEIERMQALGCPTVFTTSAGTALYTAWFDARSLFGSLVEVYQANPFVLESKRFIREVSEGWDGSRPSRPFEELMERPLAAASGAGLAQPEWVGSEGQR